MSRSKMVGWYRPLQLIQTGAQVAFSTLLGDRADSRLLQALGGAQAEFDFSDRAELWLDYAADVGDGWNATYAIASLLAQDLVLKDPRGAAHATRRGAVLVLGGDEVYPTPSRGAYQERFVAPYESAFGHSEPPHPALFAIPGNHDWYDGLASFLRLFCQHRWIGGWKTRQARSYFALKLPHGVWLLGVDIQLEADIDKPQVDYFCAMAQRMCPGDRVILCVAEPDWIYGNIYDSQLQKNLAFLERQIERQSGARIVARIAGDLHHYRHHEGDDGTHCITAGGGGAFLHPTHGPSVDEIQTGTRERPVRMRLRASFPTPAESRRLAWGNLWFIKNNPSFSVATGLCYFVLASAFPLRDHQSGFLGYLQQVLYVIGQSAASLSILVVVVLAFVLFTDTHHRAYRWVAGTLHALAHCTAALASAWGADRLADAMVQRWDPQLTGLGHLYLSRFGVLLGGALLGPVIMGLYLYLSINLFKRHSNESFSALAIEDFKNFLRLHIDAQGTLRVYPVGLREVPRRWREVPGREAASEPRFVSEGGPMEPHLIEEPIVIAKSGERVDALGG